MARHYRHRPAHIFGLLLALACVAMPAVDMAGEHGRVFHGHPEHDHDRARHALERGEVRPLAEILEQVSAMVPGEVIEVELERWHAHGRPRWAYEISIITPDGRLRELYIDAATGDILAEEDD